MISQITGTVDSITENALNLSVGGISYEVFIPTSVLRHFDGKLGKNSQVSLVTYHYYQTDPSKSIPVLIGFSNRIEKEFFEKFITVSGVGPKAAVKALKPPIPDIAAAIDAGDLTFLKSLPGIGEQRAKEIIAKLQGKMAKFGLMRGGTEKTHEDGSRAAAVVRQGSPSVDEVQAEALEVLLQLQYKRDEAREMIRKAFTRKTTLSSAEEILNEVYRQRKETK